MPIRVLCFSGNGRNHHQSDSQRNKKKPSRTRSTILAVIFLLIIPSITPSSNLIAILPARDDFSYGIPLVSESASSQEREDQQEEEVISMSGRSQQGHVYNADDSSQERENHQEEDVISMSGGSLQVPGYNADDYHIQLQEAMEVSPDNQTACYVQKFYSGLNNQLMRFLGIVSLAAVEGYPQYLEPSILWKDTYGTSEKISHCKLWDVVHWNTFFPHIPRLVRYDSRYHPHVVEVEKVIELEEGISIKVPEMKYNVTWDIWANRSNTKPAPSGTNPNQSVNQYKKMMRVHDINGRNIGKIRQFLFYRTMIAGALKPHPFLQNLVDTEKAKLAAGGKYMALHARVEPDMARQDRVCTTVKVWNITDILEVIYKQFPEPPVNTVLMQFSRQQMEAELRRKRNIDKYTAINEQNLKVINELIKEGMWDGRVKVVEAGSSLVEESGDPFYKRYSTIAGGIVNMFLAIHSDIFIGTEVSTYSVMTTNARFHRGLLENYFYVPEGLKEVARTKQYRFGC